MAIFILLEVVALFLLFPCAFAVRVTEHIAWNEGAQFAYAWVAHITILTVAVVLNGMSLYLVVSVEKVRSIASANFISALNLIDFLGAVGCLGVCALNFNFKELYGHELGCQSEAMRLAFFVFWAALVLALIAYASERRVCASIHLAPAQEITLVLAAAFVALVLAIIAVYSPGGGYRLYPSGTYCFLNMTQPLAGSIFAGSVLLTTAIMADRYLRIWMALHRAQKLLRKRGLMNTKAKAKSAFVAAKMSLFILNFFGCCAPYLAVALYEVITWQYAPYGLDVAGGIAIHFMAVINPLLFLFLNEDMQVASKEVFWDPVYKTLLHGTSSTNTMSKKSIIYPSPSSLFKRAKKMGGGAAASSCSSSSFSSYTHDHEEWELWVNDAAYSAIFFDWCEKNFVIENMLFYKDVAHYHDLGGSVIGKISWAVNNGVDLDVTACDCSDSSSPSSSPSFSPSFVTLEWHNELHQLACKIYEVYIQVPTAPLEVNIPHTTRDTIEDTLLRNRYMSSNGVLLQSVTPMPPSNKTTIDTQPNTPMTPMTPETLTISITPMLSMAPMAPDTPMSNCYPPTSLVPTAPSNQPAAPASLAPTVLFNQPSVPASLAPTAPSNQPAVPASLAPVLSLHNPSATNRMDPDCSIPAPKHLLPPFTNNKKEKETPSESHSLPDFPSVWRLPPNDARDAAKEIYEVFDKAFFVICKVISTDVFPRFKKCDKYLITKDDAAYQARLLSLSVRRRQKSGVSFV